VKASSTRQPSALILNNLSPYRHDYFDFQTDGNGQILEMIQSYLTCNAAWNIHCSFVGQRRTGPRLSLVSPKVFSPFCHLMEFWFLATAALAFGLLRWGHLIFNNIIDLPYLRWTLTQFSSRNKLCCIIFMLSLWSCFDTICFVKSAI